MKNKLLITTALVAVFFIADANATIEVGKNNNITISGDETLNKAPTFTDINNNGNLTFSIQADRTEIDSNIINNKGATINNTGSNNEILILKGKLTNSGEITNVFHLEGEVINNKEGSIDAARFANKTINNGHVGVAYIESTFNNNGTINDASVSGTRNGVLNANLGSSIQKLYLANGAEVNAEVAEMGDNNTAQLGNITVADDGNATL